MHLVEGRTHVVEVADDVRGKLGRRGQFPAQLVTQQPLVEALHRGQQGQFPFVVLNQNQILRDGAFTCLSGLLLSSRPIVVVEPKQNRGAIGYVVTEVRTKTSQS